MGKKKIIWVVLALIALPFAYKGAKLLYASYLSYNANNSVGQTVPDLVGMGLNSEIYRLHDYIGKKKIILVFWATWCKGCLREMPRIKKAYERIPKDSDTILLSSSIDEDIELVKQVVREKSIPYPVIVDQEGRGKKSAFNTFFSLTHLPSIWVIDKRGVVAAHNLIHIEQALKKVKELP